MSKKTLDVCIKSENSAEVFMKVENSKEGWSKIVAQLQDMGVADTGVILLEATGDYHLGCAHHLDAAGFMIKVTNPFIVSSFRKMDMRKTKTDKLDSQKLAALACGDTDIPEFRVSDDMGARKLARLKQTYVRVRQELRNTVSSIKDSESSGVVDLSIQITMLTESIRHMNKSIKRIERLLLEQKNVKRVIDTVGPIKGVSENSVAQVIGEIGDITRFKNKGQLTAFCGLDPSIRRSGSSVRGKSRISKRGSPGLRKTLTQAAWGLMMHDGDSKMYYIKKKAEGKHYFTCLVAIARQFIIHLWAAIRKGEKYMTASMIAVKMKMKINTVVTV